LIFFFIYTRPPLSPLFPYTTLFRSGGDRRRQQYRRQRRQRVGDPDEANSADRQCDLRDLARPARTSYPAAGGSGGKARRLHRERSEEHTSELQSRGHLVCRLLLEKK